MQRGSLNKSLHLALCALLSRAFSSRVMQLGDILWASCLNKKSKPLSTLPCGCISSDKTGGLLLFSSPCLEFLMLEQLHSRCWPADDV